MKRSFTGPDRFRLQLLAALAVGLAGCAAGPATEKATSEVAAVSKPLLAPNDVTLHLDDWPALNTPPLDPDIETRIDAIMAKMTLEQKVGQVIQADNTTVTPEDVKKYRLGSVLSGGNSAPGGKPYADTKTWLAAADGYFNASVDPEGVDVAIPVIWGIDAVHGHANLLGATVFPHNIGLGAAHDPDLIEEIMKVTASELVVSGHDWTFAPTLATPRDDRWGRTYEGFSESPEIVASYADRIVYGLQGRPGDAGFLGDGHVISSAKHFMADGGTFGGKDQGDARISEEELRSIHAPGYESALQGGVQTVMASYSSWNGTKMHGSKTMLTELLKGRFGFNGFVVGDWNGHGQIPGCTNTDCPQAINAGLDMYMAPDSWKGLYESTLVHVKAGDIPMDRLDDAVRRILRVKLAYGLFEKGPPSSRPGAGDESLLGSPEHRAVARRAVRESLVLLKNDGGVLPLAGKQRVLVVGDGADNIGKQAGGWTLSWQGGDYDNTYFPNGQSILGGIREAVLGSGGTLIFDPTGSSTADADVVIAVYGENPYAEGVGDVKSLDFKPNGFDTAKLKAFRDRGIPVVSVFLSGRPLWVNPELNNSDAFVAAWLPGTEGGGVADVLFRTRPEYDFTGRLSFSWPKTADSKPLNKEDANYDPLFPFGYGLSYTSAAPDLGPVSEDPGNEPQADADLLTVFTEGENGETWAAVLYQDGVATPVGLGKTSLGELTVSHTDFARQEDALLLTWSGAGTSLVFGSPAGRVDLSGKGAAFDLVFRARAPDAEAQTLTISGGCSPDGGCTGVQSVTIEPGDWAEVRIPAACIGMADVSAVPMVAKLDMAEAGAVAIADVHLEAVGAGDAACMN
ncbi:MAG: glycoside hydrolase family 3 N-terminal domain-containing protein [Hyphomonas sp.]|nr:glycoside hydrolase family 3 C-terminal domain-containing protein [Hyphomonas sp.]MCB9971355.1 glycoside hydrolase family 3 C-terminal domain-containing protein [Hyphomonas sp.]